MTLRRRNAPQSPPSSWCGYTTKVRHWLSPGLFCNPCSSSVSFTREEVEGEIELLRIGPGEHFGEIGLLTGAAATARISALTATTVYELAKGNLTPVLEARPEVAHALGRALARRQAAGALSVSAEVDGSVPQHRLTEWFMERL